MALTNWEKRYLRIQAREAVANGTSEKSFVTRMVKGGIKEATARKYYKIRVRINQEK